MRYPDVPNPDLLNRIPLDARTVLDVGCGTGSLLAAYRKLNPRARLLGIEQREDAAPIAATTGRGRDGGCQGQPGAIHKHRANRLHHLWRRDRASAESVALLRRHAAMLSDAGTMLICVPNVEHWSFAARLLQGTWDYEPTGLFDFTHLRWFSLETMRRRLGEIGLVPCDVHPRIFDADKAENFAAMLGHCRGARHRRGWVRAASEAASICLACAQASPRSVNDYREHAEAGRGHQSRTCCLSTACVGD